VKDALVELAGVRKTYVDRGSFAARMMGLTRAVHAVAGVDLTIRRGETVGLVGESGCGKSTLARALVRLEDVDDGDVVFDGHNVTELRERQLGWFRKRAQIVFQDPQSALNRSLKIETILARALQLRGVERGRDRCAELLRTVGLDPAFVDRYPHELSGGQRQRVNIARALAVEPEFLVLDEPVSALDVSIQAQVLNLLQDLQERFGLTYLFVSHDLNVVRYLCDRVAVMYLGRIVELGPVDDVYAAPAHPYTELLLSAVAEPDPALRHEAIAIRGEVPSPFAPPPGCPFHPRCPRAFGPCAEVRPALAEVGRRSVACHLHTPPAAAATNQEKAVSCD
jgi:oligopeptide/dipeptide ABC transporter ATP-binding protein